MWLIAPLAYNNTCSVVNAHYPRCALHQAGTPIRHTGALVRDPTNSFNRSTGSATFQLIIKSGLGSESWHYSVRVKTLVVPRHAVDELGVIVHLRTLTLALFAAPSWGSLHRLQKFLSKSVQLA